jgi:hypothetical protein
VLLQALLREQPADPAAFAADYFAALLAWGG